MGKRKMGMRGEDRRGVSRRRKGRRGADLACFSFGRISGLMGAQAAPRSSSGFFSVELTTLTPRSITDALSPALHDLAVQKTHYTLVKWDADALKNLREGTVKTITSIWEHMFCRAHATCAGVSDTELQGQAGFGNQQSLPCGKPLVKLLWISRKTSFSMKLKEGLYRKL